MSTHVLVRYEIIDESAYQRYLELAGPTLAPHGGSLVAKGTETHHLEGGDSLSNFALLEFPNPDAAKAWYASDRYAEARNARSGAGMMTLSIVEN